MDLKYKQLNSERIREISQASFITKKLFELVPVTQKVRELVKTFKQNQAKSALFALKRNKLKIKVLRPIGVNWNSIGEHGSAIENSGQSRESVEFVCDQLSKIQSITENN